MSKRTNVAYVTYQEAQKLIPVFKYYAKEGQWRELRADARAIAHELEDVRNADYSPLPGSQVFLSEKQWEFFNDVRAEVE